jgi:hypothetical protein
MPFYVRPARLQGSEGRGAATQSQPVWLPERPHGRMPARTKPQSRSGTKLPRRAVCRSFRAPPLFHPIAQSIVPLSAVTSLSPHRALLPAVWVCAHARAVACAHTRVRVRVSMWGVPVCACVCLCACEGLWGGVGGRQQGAANGCCRYEGVVGLIDSTESALKQLALLFLTALIDSVPPRPEPASFDHRRATRLPLNRIPHEARGSAA